MDVIVGDGQSRSPRVMRRRGRPTKGGAAELSQRIVDIAFRQFLDAGYADTSMDSVASEARVSKRTLYDRFPSKVHLFEAALHQQILFDYDALKALEAQGGPVDALLLELALWLRENIFCSTAVSLFRLLAAEGHRHPELAHYSEDTVMRPVVETLASILDRAAKRGEVRDMPPRFMANQFIQAVCGSDIRARIYGIGQEEAPEVVERRIRDTVSLFLHGAEGRDRPPASER